MNGWNTTFLLERPIFQGRTVSFKGRVSIPNEFFVKVWLLWLTSVSEKKSQVITAVFGVFLPWQITGRPCCGDMVFPAPWASNLP